MRFHLPTATAIALALGLAAAPVAAQNAAEQDADRMFGDYTDTGMIQNVDEIGRIIEVDGIRYLLDESVDVADLNVGEQVMVRFEQASIGTELVATEVESVVE